MNVDELLAVKAKVGTAIASRVAQKRKLLTASLERLNSLANKPTGALSKVRANELSKRRTLAAKYRNPSNPKETWARIREHPTASRSVTLAERAS